MSHMTFSIGWINAFAVRDYLRQAAFIEVEGVKWIETGFLTREFTVRGPRLALDKIRKDLLQWAEDFDIPQED